MATTSEAAPAQSVGAPRTLPWWGFGLANVAVVTVLSVLLWWLIADPAWSPLGIYPQPFNAALFWIIIATVWLGFTFGWLGPQRLPQPARGLVGIVLALVIGVGITLLLAFVYGAIDPTFAAGREGGAGYTTGNLVVLFAFFFYVIAVVNWGQWPWAPKTEQPLRGLGELGLLAIPTVALYAVLVLPILATWKVQGTALFSVFTLIGWFYSVIVAVVITGLLTENWPWRLAGSGAGMVVFSLIGNFVLGTGLYFLNLGVATLLMGGDNAAALAASDATPLGPMLPVFAAQFGVCWVFWMVAWPNVFGNYPTHRGDAVNFAVRLVVTFVLGVLTFLLYYFVLAGSLLHEPPPIPGTTLYGDALGFMDLVVLITLWYVLFLGSYGLPGQRPLEVPPDTVAENTDRAAEPDRYAAT